MLGIITLQRSLNNLLITFCLIGRVNQSNTSIPSEIALAVTQPAFSKVPDLSGARAIRIRDYWNGLSFTAPEYAGFYLERRGGEFIGTAEFEAGGYSSGGSLTATVELVVPLEVVEKFLQKLTESQVEVDKYIIPPTHTDDYPEFTINVTTHNGSVEFFSDSQNADRTPWRFSSTISEGSLCRTECVIRSDLPTQAVSFLEPYLKREVHAQLIDNIIDRSRNTSQP